MWWLSSWVSRVLFCLCVSCLPVTVFYLVGRCSLAFISLFPWGLMLWPWPTACKYYPMMPVLQLAHITGYHSVQDFVPLVCPNPSFLVKNSLLAQPTTCCLSISVWYHVSSLFFTSLLLLELDCSPLRSYQVLTKSAPFHWKVGANVRLCPKYRFYFFFHRVTFRIWWQPFHHR